MCVQMLVGDSWEQRAVKKRPYSSVWSVPELMHVVAMCEERLPLVELGDEVPTYIHTLDTYTCITLDNVHSSQAQGLNLRRGRSLGGKVTVDISDVQTDGFLDEI